MPYPEIIYNEALLYQAQQDCLRYHEGQKRKKALNFEQEPLDYAAHPFFAMVHALTYKGKSKNGRAIAIALLLHDTVEDTGITLNYILDRYGPMVLTLVMEMTNDPKAIAKYGKVAYQKRKLIGVSNYGFFGKQCDWLANAEGSPSSSQVLNILEISTYVRDYRRFTATQQEIQNRIDMHLYNWVGHFDLHGVASTLCDFNQLEQTALKEASAEID